MKTFFANKLNYLVILLLSAAIGIVGFLGYTYLNVSKDVVVPDFLGKNKSEVFDWCGQLDPKYSCEIVYEKSRSVQKDLVFQQSINAGSPLKDKITITISSELEQPLVLPQLYNTGKEDIEKWQKENGVENVTIVYENSDTVNKDAIIRIEPSENIFKDTPVTVYISSGRANASDDKIEVKSGEYTNLTVSAFESQVKALGLKPNHNTAKDDYSTSVTKGNIVWHGSGTYENGETINYGICLDQKKDASSLINIKAGTYVGKSEDDFKKIATDLGLVAVHNSDWDDYSDSYAKGNIVKHGSGDYEKGENFRYGLSLGEKDNSSTTTDIVVTNGQYVGKTESEFKTIAANLGLKANHIDTRDAYSDTIAKGNIVTHGYGTYVKGEDFNYGVSLGKKDGESSQEIYISSGKYIGKSESEFQAIATGLNLKPVHNEEWDTYSDSVAKGYIVKHGSGTYVKDENFRYGLSLGKAPDVTVTVADKSGSSEESFKSYIVSLGLKAGTRSEEYSDSVSAGNLIRNDTGSFKKGASVNYTVSLGKKETPSGNIMRPEKYQVGDTYDSTKQKMQSYLSVFTNVEYIGVTSTKGVGRLEKIEVGSAGSSYSAGSYPVDTPIKVYIVNKQQN